MRALPRLIAFGFVAAGLTGAGASWPLGGSRVAKTIALQTMRATGLNARISGPITMKLLPRPRIQIGGLALDGADGAVLVDAPVLKAEIDIPSLIRGQWRLTSVTLIEPTITLDIDRLLAQRDERQAQHDTRSPLPLQVHLRSGVLRTRSSNAFADSLTTGLDVTATWAANDDAVVVSGSTIWRGTSVQFAGSLDHPARILTPGGAASDLQVESPLFSLSASGLLSGGAQERFVGRVAASTPALPKMLRTFDGFPVSIGARRAQISGNLVAKTHDVSLSNAQLKLDHAKFEGTLAMRRENGRSLVAGTLATDLLDVDALLGNGADRRDLGTLYRQTLDAASFGTDVDMRVSASSARIGRLTLDDMAFAALLRADRFELTLDEASAYGGLLKARAIANLYRQGIDAHADVSATRVDLGRLSDALSGEDRVGGLITAHAALDGRGSSLRDLVSGLGGHGQMSIDNGRLAGLSLGQTLRRLSHKLPIEMGRGGPPTTFDRAVWDFSVDNGTVKIPEGKLTAPGVQMSFDGQTALPDGTIDVHAVAARTDAGGAPVRGKRFPFDLRGFWDRPVILVGHSGGLDLPALSFPLMSPAPALP